jgi:hypothetical protein
MHITIIVKKNKLLKKEKEKHNNTDRDYKILTFIPYSQLVL